MGSRLLWLRWSGRDLRRRWVLVVAIAVVIGLGTGLYAGLTSTSAWRRQSNDASFAALRVHDLEVGLSPGDTVRRGRLAAALVATPHADWVTGAQERLVLPIQIDASHPGRTVLVPGEIVGMDAAAGSGAVDGVSAAVGRTLAPGDRGAPVAVVERAFATKNALPPTGTLRVSGGRELRYVGQGQSPEYFVVTGNQGGFLSEAGFGVLFTSVETAQAFTGHRDAVNDLVLTLRPGADRGAFRAGLERALAARLPDSSTTVTTRDDIPAHRILYEDIDNDQELWNVLAALVLAGAVFAAFNLVGRVVEAQRREIGVGMALGVSPGWLALRPLLLGVQVALLGVVAGIAVGVGVGAAFASLLRTMAPLPVWRTPFQYGVFVRAALLGLVLPVLAVTYPVWRAVRAEPVDAIRVAAVAGRTGRLGALLRRVPLPGGSISQLPLRNAVRTPRRTVLTAVGIGAALTALVAFTGMLDTFTRTVDRAERELTRAAPDRLTVTLSGVRMIDSPAVAALSRSPAVAVAEPGLQLPGTLRSGDKKVDVVTEIFDLRRGMWAPEVVRGTGAGGLVLAEKAAHDLGVRPGDTVLLRHPQRVGPGYRMVDTPIRVAGLHAFPIRSVTYLDSGDAGAFALAGTANVVRVRPAPGHGEDGTIRALFGLPGVGSVQPVTAGVRQIRDSLQSFVGILQIAEVLVLLLALLIAFNAMSIAVEERRREHATMLAFGVSARRVLGLTTVESGVIGLLGTLLGIVAGFGVLRWTIEVLLPEVLPDIGMRAVLSAPTLAVTLLLGVVAVALAPLLSYRRVSRMDIPATLRVVE